MPLFLLLLSIYKNKPLIMRKIHLTEAQFKKVIAEKVSEISYNTIHNASSKYLGRNIYAAKNAILTLREILSDFDSSFHKIHGQEALNYFYANKKAPAEGAASKFLEYLDEMEKFFDRKEAQEENFNKTADSKEEEYKNYLLGIAREQYGYQGNSIEDFARELGAKDEAAWKNGDFSDSNWNGFLDKITDPDVRAWAEEYGF